MEKPLNVHEIQISEAAMAVATVELDAAERFMRSRGKTTPANYVHGSEAKASRERCYAEALESNPALYATLREAHNAAATIRTLEKAGYRLR